VTRPPRIDECGCELPPRALSTRGICESVFFILVRRDSPWRRSQERSRKGTSPCIVRRRHNQESLRMCDVVVIRISAVVLYQYGVVLASSSLRRDSLLVECVPLFLGFWRPVSSIGKLETPAHPTWRCHPCGLSVFPVFPILLFMV
jgi:hypothetical protein